MRPYPVQMVPLFLMLLSTRLAMPNASSVRAGAIDNQIAHLSQRFNHQAISVADVGITQLTVQVRVRERMAKGRMEVRQRAKEIGASVAKEIAARVAKDGAAKVWKKETEAKEERREIFTEQKRQGKWKGEEGHERA